MTLIPVSYRQPARCAAILFLGVLFTFSEQPLHAVTIDFEAECSGGAQASGPCSSLFSSVGNAESLNVSTSIGTVAFQGGALLDDTSNLPADETAVYGTAANAVNIGVTAGSGFTNPLTITFPTAINNFSLDILNGNTMTVTYELADNKGNSATFDLAPNLSGALQSVGFAAAGNQITISALTGQSTSSGMTWDFLIDNIQVDQPLSGGVPEPTEMILIGAGLIGLACLGRFRKPHRRALGLVAALIVLPLAVSVSSAATSSIALSCPSGAGTVGASYSAPLTALGGVPPYTFSITSGALPSGLTLNPSTGQIQGTPLSAGTDAFTAHVVDSLIVGAGGSPDSTSASCQIVVSPAAAPVLTSLNPTTAVAGGATFPLSVTGSGFFTNSTVLWNGTPVPTTFVSTSQLTASISALLITTPQVANISVTANSQTSNSLTFPVDEVWTEVLDQFAVTFGQVTPTLPGSPVTDWQTGLFSADFLELRQDGITGGYLQVMEYDEGQPLGDGTWVVQNLPVLDPNTLPGNGMTFTFTPAAAGPRAQVLVAVGHTRAPVAQRGAGQTPHGWPPFNQNPAQRLQFPIGPLPTTIGGVAIPKLNTPIPMIGPIDPKANDSVNPLDSSNNVEQQKNECGPGAVSNSMAYLDVQDGKQNVPSLDSKNKPDPNSRVGALDTAMGYDKNKGTPTSGILNGKKKYIADNNLKVTTNSQGRFCPTASTAPDCKDGEWGDSGNAPTPDFIVQALKDKKDVEVCFTFATGAHCVFVTGYQYVNGFLALHIAQDARQGGKGGVSDKDGGYLDVPMGKSNDGRLWLNWYGQPALVTHVITEAPMK